MRSFFYKSLMGTLFLLCLSCRGLSGDPEVDRKLMDARADLALAEGVHQRVESDYQEMQKNPDVPPEKVLAMEAYVKELEEMVQVRKNTLDDLSAIAGVEASEVDPTVSEGVREFEEAVGQVPDTKEPETEEERLDREFQASLEEFDGMILTYNQKLEAKLDARIARGEAAAGKQQSAVEEAEALLKSMGVETGDTGKQGEETEASEVAGQPEGTETPAETGGESTAVAENGTQGTQTGGSGHRPPTEDEDIVARQLREAAEKETDPVLREKLWKEYEAYLDGRS